MSEHDTKLLDDDLRSIIYHQAAHIVVAAAQGLRVPFPKVVISIEKLGVGKSFYWRSNGSGLTPDATAVTAYAGLTAQKRFCSEIANATVSSYLKKSLDQRAWDDTDRAVQLINANYPDWQAATSRLRTESQNLVDNHWNAVRAVANALERKEWEPTEPARVGHPAKKELRLRGLEIPSIVNLHSLSLVERLDSADSTHTEPEACVLFPIPEDDKRDAAIREEIAGYGKLLGIVSERSHHAFSVDFTYLLRNTQTNEEFALFDYRTLPMPELQESIRQQLEAHGGKPPSRAS